MIRSVFAKIFLWFLVAMLSSIAALFVTQWVLSSSVRQDDPFVRTMRLQAELLRRGYESGGKAELAKLSAQLDEIFPGKRHLVDLKGQDLLTGEDKSQLVAKAVAPGLFPRFTRPPAVGLPIGDGKYRYLIEVSGRAPSLWSTIPYSLWILLFVGVLWYPFTKYLIAPVQQLRETVDRFGRGDLTVRTGSTRADEFGQVSRAFDQMAERIETLLTAERRLLQDVSHELRTPLSRLGFAIELARTSNDREASLARIRKEVDRLSALVGQLLQVTRAEGDPGSRELEEISLNGLLAEVAEDAAWEAEIRQVRIACRVTEQVTEQVSVLGDGELLRRAVENVVRNAIRYAPGNSTVEVTLDRDRGHAFIRVRDQGPGVAEQHLTEIFKPFFREDVSRTGSTGGVGLGLAIVSRAVNLHHGAVRAQNTQPGLMVEIELPAAA